MERNIREILQSDVLGLGSICQLSHTQMMNAINGFGVFRQWLTVPTSRF